MLAGNQKAPQHGFSLIEALIALVVLSLGLIGVASMQLKALQSATSGYQRSVASLAALDAQERLWAQLVVLEPSQTCDDIDVSAVQEAWRSHWLYADPPTPLRRALPALTTIVKASGNHGCHLRINVALSDDENDQLHYLFSLPRIESLP
ncbi:MAG: type IV pilus modification protein PilV [Halomonas sp.]|nr:type IV pilus modification protein PilV [Halomonas sp.]TVP46399.1 MAG: type IV pilus modification protein PilV [Halomonas sp.]